MLTILFYYYCSTIVLHALTFNFWLNYSYWIITYTNMHQKLIKLMMLKSHHWVTQSSHTRNDICTEKKGDLTESTGVVPAKYLSKVKLELFS